MGEKFVWFIILSIPALYFPLSETAFSMPNYARQSNVSCFTCHSQPASTLGASADSKDSVNNLLSAPDKGIQTKLEAHTSGSEAANAEVSGIRSRRVTELYLTKGDKYDQGLNGLSGYFNGKGFYADLSLFSLDQKMADPEGKSSPMTVWYRFGVAPKVGGVNLALGVFGEMVSLDGTSAASASGTDDETDTIGLDAKIKGQIGNVTLNLKAMYLNSISSYVTATSMRTGRSQATVYAQELSEGFGAAARLNIRKVFGLSAAYRTYKSKDAQDPTQTNLASIGAWVSLSKDMTIESQYTTVGENSSFLTEESAFTLLFITSF
ncbi:hypothetical protein MNBD_NITROSPINAE02-2141 [hydrothermal vent metagenome]|uniref:Uncharacterized protein n=1 Tax=hydrothermal vent metagenome TaxID=652676 RepID=A0A3B1BPT1_9ZZZZ